MTRRALLLDIGAGPLPNTTPPATVSATWAPAVYVPPPVPVPGGFAAAGVVDGVLLSWSAVPGTGVVYAIERAADVSGAPGAWSEVTRVTATQHSMSIANGTAYFWRARAFVFGRGSAYTPALKAAPAATSGALLRQALVLDGDLEGGGQGWSFGSGARLESSANVAYEGTTGLVKDPDNSFMQSAPEWFTVNPGEIVIGECMIRNLHGGANGAAYLAIWYYNASGGFVGGGTVNNWAAAPVGLEGWRRVTGSNKAPATAKFCKVGCEVPPGHTQGYWCFDKFRAQILRESNIGAANLLPNSNFGGVNGYLSPWGVYWNSENVPYTLNSKLGHTAGPDWRIAGHVGILELRQLNGVIGTYGVFDLTCGERISVVAGKRYQAHAKLAVHRCNARIYIQWFTAADQFIHETAGSLVSAGTADGGTSETGYVLSGLFEKAPANAAAVRMFLRKGNTLNNAADSWMWAIKPFFGEAAEHQVEYSPWVEAAPYSADGLSNGTHFGTVSQSDLHDGFSSRRIGMRVAGSGHRIGDNRNLPQIMVGNGRAKVNTTISYTAAAGSPATATISVGAFTILAGYSVAYNASSVGVSGSGGSSVTYHLYMDDPGHVGGARTLVATTNGNDVYSNDGRVYIGTVTVTYPTSGTSGGGGERIECIAFGQFVDAETLVEAARPDHLFDCIDWPGGRTRPFRRPLHSVDYGVAPCVRLVTECGAALVCSVTTPFDLPDGRTALAPDMLGEHVLTDAGVERVVNVICAGLQRVAHIHLGGISFAAGEDPAHRIYSHNQTQKP